MRYTLLAVAVILAVVRADCPYAHGTLGNAFTHQNTPRQDVNSDTAANDFLQSAVVDDTDVYLTSDNGVPMYDQASLKAGTRGPTLLEDWIFRQKIMHFDHERVPERAVHARGAGAHGTFTSYADWSNITAASFLSQAGKQTPVFVRFSTVAGSRGSADTARDVRGFATRFYTDEGNFDIVGNDIPVFFIQDAIRFPDLIHAVKPQPNNEIPQAATAHDNAWDFFSQSPTTLHTLFWAMSGHGLVRSFRHMDGAGVHTFRLVTNDGSTCLVKWHLRTMTGRAALTWEQAQAIAGFNSDYHRRDLFNEIAAGRFPQWEVGVQIMKETDQLKYGFDLLDATKLVPFDLVPITPLGILELNTNPTNYFAETEQVMFQVGHVVRGIDFTEDPLMQGRIFSYLDTQLNRHGGPNFEQIPINRPRMMVHNNERDGAAQMYIHSNNAPYTPNTLNNGSPMEANETVGNGFFTAPDRTVNGPIARVISPTFANYYSQPLLFFNSLLPAEQQAMINAMRFELSMLSYDHIRTNMLVQLNRVSNDIASRVATALGMTAPAPDSSFSGYHNTSTPGLRQMGEPLYKIDGLTVGILTSNQNGASLATAQQLASALMAMNLNAAIVAETLAGANMTYSGADGTGFDAVVILPSAFPLFQQSAGTASTLFPPERPSDIVNRLWRWGSAIGFMGGSNAAVMRVLKAANVPMGDGVYTNATTVSQTVANMVAGLTMFKFLDRFPVDAM